MGRGRAIAGVRVGSGDGAGSVIVLLGGIAVKYAVCLGVLARYWLQVKGIVCLGGKS